MTEDDIEPTRLSLPQGHTLLFYEYDFQTENPYALWWVEGKDSLQFSVNREPLRGRVALDPVIETTRQVRRAAVATCKTVAAKLRAQAELLDVLAVMP